MWISDSLIILHIPKTGGNFVKSCCNELLGIPGRVAGVHAHTSINDLINKHRYSVEDIKKRYIMTFVRHPVTRLQSLWAYYKSRQPDKPLEFDELVRHALENKDNLMITDCNKFIWDSIVPVNFIGRYENLVGDFITGLKNAGENFNEVLLLDNAHNKINNSGGWKARAIYEPKLLQELLEAEKLVIDTFYKDSDELKNICTK